MSKMDFRSFARRGDALVPVDAAAHELVGALPEGPELRVLVRQPRNPRHSARFHVMMHKVQENLEAWAHRDYEEFLDAIKLSVGHAETRMSLDGELHKRPKSIDFANMDEIAFKRFEKRVVFVLQQTFGIDAEALMGVVEEETRPVGRHRDGAELSLSPAPDEAATMTADRVEQPAAPSADGELALAGPPSSDGEAGSPVDNRIGPAPRARPRDRQLLRRYADRMGEALQEKTLTRGSAAFLMDHNIAEGMPAYEVAAAIFSANLARVRGESSPAEVDAIVMRVLS